MRSRVWPWRYFLMVVWILWHINLHRLFNANLTATTQECCQQYWTGPGGNTQQSSSCMATYDPSRKVSKLDETDMQDTAGEVGTSSQVMYSYGPLHMAEQMQGDQREPTYSRIQGVVPRTCQMWCTIERGGERGSTISVLMTRQDYIYIYI